MANHKSGNETLGVSLRVTDAELEQIQAQAAAWANAQTPPVPVSLGGYVKAFLLSAPAPETDAEKEARLAAVMSTSAAAQLAWVFSGGPCPKCGFSPEPALGAIADAFDKL